jgi:hypothetical protein
MLTIYNLFRYNAQCVSDLACLAMLREVGHFLGSLLYVCFSFVGFQCGPTEVVEGIHSYAYLRYYVMVLSYLHLYCCYC